VPLDHRSLREFAGAFSPKSNVGSTFGLPHKLARWGVRGTRSVGACRGGGSISGHSISGSRSSGRNTRPAGETSERILERSKRARRSGDAACRPEEHDPRAEVAVVRRLTSRGFFSSREEASVGARELAAHEAAGYDRGLRDAEARWSECRAGPRALRCSRVAARAATTRSPAGSAGSMSAGTSAPAATPFAQRRLCERDNEENRKDGRGGEIQTGNHLADLFDLQSFTQADRVPTGKCGTAPVKWLRTSSS
jgi:hypothetical protein